MKFEKIVGSTRHRYRQKDDCSIIMVAALAGVDYDVAARVLRQCGKSDGDGATDGQWKLAMVYLGCRIHRVRCIRRTIRTVTRALPKTGKYIIVTTDHVVAFINGELIDDTKWGDLLRVTSVYKVDLV